MGRLKALLSGILIGMSGIAYLQCPNKIIGAGLFSFGLITIILLQLPLYTGKIAYINKDTNIIEIGLMLVYNLLGAIIIGLCFSGVYQQVALNITLNKINNIWYLTLIKSICCGICIYSAVEGYKKSNSIIAIIIPVIVFITCGFEHCIANMFYFSTSLIDPALIIKHTIITIAGNTIGGIISHRITLLTK